MNKEEWEQIIIEGSSDLLKFLSGCGILALEWTDLAQEYFWRRFIIVSVIIMLCALYFLDKYYKARERQRSKKHLELELELERIKQS